MGIESDMMDVDSIDMERLAAAASNLGLYPVLPERLIKEFLREYPFPLLFSALSRSSEFPGFVDTLVNALGKIFQSPYGSHLIPEVLPYATSGLSADSASIRQLACIAVSKLIERADEASVRLLESCQVVRPLLETLNDEESTVGTSAADALANLAKTPAGLELLFREKGSTGSSLLTEIAAKGRSLVRIRTLSLAARILGQSDMAAAAVYNSGIIDLLENEVYNSGDTLAQLNALELISELAKAPAGRNMLNTKSFLEQVVSLTSAPEGDGLVRSRAMLVGSQLIAAVSESRAREIIDAISAAVSRLEGAGGTGDESVKEAGITAIGQIGLSANGAEVVLEGPRPVAFYVIREAFMGRGSLQQAAVYALAQIAGAERDSPTLSQRAENSLRSLIYDVVNQSTHASFSSKILSLLRQAPEIRHATYRLLVPLVARSWCLWELSSEDDIVDLLADPRTETSTSKEAMEWRHSCCVALATALSSAAQRGETVPGEIVEKLDAAVRRGPFLSKESVEAIPLVAAEERF